MRDLALIILGVFIAMTFDFAFPKTYDEKKWERLKQQRMERRAKEQEYEACISTCRETCK